MFCRNCGTSVDDKAVACMNCGCAPLSGKKFCSNCGKETLEAAVICVGCGVPFRQPSSGVNLGDSKKLIAGLCGILLGALGVHKFVLGYTKEGVIMLLITLLTCGFGAMISGVIGLIEGIIYLTKSDQEFDQIYVQGQRPWF